MALSCGAKLLNEWEVQGSQYSDNFHACTTAPGNTKRTAFCDTTTVTRTNCIFLARTDFIIHFVAVNKT